MVWRGVAWRGVVWCDTNVVLILEQAHKAEGINGCRVGDLLRYGVVQFESEDEETRIQMSKFLLRLVCLEDRPRRSKHASAYLPPDVILRTIRDYHGEIQELAHLWSLVVAFNALASLVYGGPRPVTFDALRPGAMQLEPPLPATAEASDEARADPPLAQVAASGDEGAGAPGSGATKGNTLASNLLKELLHVDRSSEEGKKKDTPLNLVRVLAGVDEQGKVDDKTRVDLHGIVNQPMFTAGLTKRNAKGIDAWAKLKHHEDKANAVEGAVGAARKEDVVVLLQTKGQMMEDSQLQGSKVLGYVESLMRSAFESADKLLISNLEAVNKLKGFEKKCQRLVAMVW